MYVDHIKLYCKLCYVFFQVRNLEEDLRAYFGEELNIFLPIPWMPRHRVLFEAVYMPLNLKSAGDEHGNDGASG
jgi:hypothetical protein